VTVRPAGGTGFGATLVVTAAICFGTLGPVSRFAFEAGVSELTLVTWRAVIGAMLVIAIAFVLARVGQVVARPLREIPQRDRLMNIVAGLANALLNLTVFLALSRISVALTLLVFYTYPGIVALASTLFFGEHLDRLRWAALGMSLIGLALVVIGAGEVGELDLIGVGLAFLAGLCQVVYALSARHGFSSIPSPQASAVTFVVAATAYLLIGFGTGSLDALAEPLASSAALAPVVWAGTIGAGIPAMAWIMGIRILGAPRAAIISTLEPVVGVALAAVLLNEIPTSLQLLGGVAIVGAAILVQWRPGVAPAEHEAAA